MPLRISPAKLGRLGEDLICRLYGFKRQPFSGGQWPRKEDLIKETQVGDLKGTVDKEVAQVKTTQNETAVLQWLQLAEFAQAETAEPRWFDVVVTKSGGQAAVFERKYLGTFDLTVGGDA